MKTFLVTGADGFLGYHAVKLLNKQSVRPRVLLPADLDPDLPGIKALEKLDIEIVNGDVNDPSSLRAACDGVNIVLHLHFAITLGGGEQVEKTLHQENVIGTRNLLEAAAQAGVKRVVVSSSSLAVGLHYEPKLLDEEADWERYGFSLPYAVSRRNAEQALLVDAEPGFPEIIVVSPSFTLGPDDWSGAPANGLVMRMSKPGFRITAPIGFGVLDVRDYAEGVLLAVERGIPGRKYILSGDNITPDQLAKAVAGEVGFAPPKWLFSLRAWMIFPVVAILELWSKLMGKPPKVTRKLLELWERYAWYDTSRARNELGWKPRPLQESLRDTIQWMRENKTD